MVIEVFTSREFVAAQYFGALCTPAEMKNGAGLTPSRRSSSPCDFV
jgi:hypothetical protein